LEKLMHKSQRQDNARLSAGIVFQFSGRVLALAGDVGGVAQQEEAGRKSS
jgi:hypothetical protein